MRLKSLVVYATFALFASPVLASSCEQIPNLIGKWSSFEIARSDATEAEGPFPEVIHIHGKDKDFMQVTMKLPSQTSPKSYVLPRKGTHRSEDVQSYKGPEGEDYTLTELADVHCEDGALFIDVTLVGKDEKGAVLSRVKGSYEFKPQSDGHLSFKKINGEGDTRMSFAATYRH